MKIVPFFPLHSLFHFASRQPKPQLIFQVGHVQNIKRYYPLHLFSSSSHKAMQHYSRPATAGAAAYCCFLCIASRVLDFERCCIIFEFTDLVLIFLPVDSVFISYIRRFIKKCHLECSYLFRFISKYIRVGVLMGRRGYSHLVGGPLEAHCKNSARSSLEYV